MQFFLNINKYIFFYSEEGVRGILVAIDASPIYVCVYERGGCTIEFNGGEFKRWLGVSPLFFSVLSRQQQLAAFQTNTELRCYV